MLSKLWKAIKKIFEPLPSDFQLRGMLHETRKAQRERDRKDFRAFKAKYPDFLCIDLGDYSLFMDFRDELVKNKGVIAGSLKVMTFEMIRNTIPENNCDYLVGITFNE